MGSIAIGSVVLNGQLLLYLCFWVAGRLALGFRLRGVPERERILSVATNAFLLWLVIWKASYVLVHPFEGIQQGIRQWLSLVYFDGGERGRWLASLIVALYVWRQMAKLGISFRQVAGMIFPFALAGWSASQALLLALGEGPAWSRAAGAGVAAALLAVYLAVSGTDRAHRWKPLVLAALAVIGIAGSGVGKDVLHASLSGFRQTAGMGQTSAAGEAEEAGVAGEARLETGVRKGQRAPEFALKDVEGHEIRLSDFRGKKVLVHFWATWCPPCRAELPHMQKFYEDFQGEDVVILAVNVTSAERSVDKVREFAADLNLTFPIVLDGEGSVTQLYRVIAYPTTYLLDSGGVIQEKYQGPMHYDLIRKAVSDIDSET